ncbi:MAG: hypothetical protein R3Y46_05330 [Opitutales bacterium]
MHNDKNKFTLEDMLSLKKAEKPSAAQWEDFNAQLKSKMLKAMVDEEPKSRFFLSPWTFAKLSAIALPAIAIMMTFVITPSSIENLSLQSPIELVQIPELETAYYSDSYFTTSSADTQYSQNIIQGLGDMTYATSDILDVKSLSF